MAPFVFNARDHQTPSFEPQEKKVAKSAALKRAAKVSTMLAPPLMELTSLLNRARTDKIAQMIPEWALKSALEAWTVRCGDVQFDVDEKHGSHLSHTAPIACVHRCVG